MTLITPRPALPALATMGTLAALAASAVNLTVFVVATASDVPLKVSGLGSTPMTLTAVYVIVASVVGTLGAALVLTVMNARARLPRRTFMVTALATLLISLIPVVSSGLPTATSLALISMHVFAAAIITTFLSRAAKAAR